MNKELILKLLNELKSDDIDNLYIASCLKASGIEDEEELFKLIPILYQCWLKDENNTCISTLSDMLVEVKDIVNLNEINIRKLLVLMYSNQLGEEE